MKVSMLLAGGGLALVLAGCDARPLPSASAPPVSTAPASAQGAPQPVNSVPPDAAVNEPVAPATGMVGRTRTAPRRR